MHEAHIQDIINQMICNQFTSSLYSNLIRLLEERLYSDKIEGFFHPLGFIIVTLSDWNEGKRLRLHIWPEKGRKYNNNQEWIHSHEYSVNSLVLMGTITNNRYNIIIDSNSRLLPIFKVSYKSKNSDLILTNKTCDIFLTQSDILTFGEFYNIKKWNYHLVHVKENSIVCTLVVNYDKDSSTGYVIGPKNTAKISLPFTRHNYNRYELKALISDLISYLKNQL